MLSHTFSDPVSKALDLHSAVYPSGSLRGHPQLQAEGRHENGAQHGRVPPKEDAMSGVSIAMWDDGQWERLACRDWMRSGKVGLWLESKACSRGKHERFVLGARLANCYQLTSSVPATLIALSNQYPRRFATTQTRPVLPIGNVKSGSACVAEFQLIRPLSLPKGTHFDLTMPTVETPAISKSGIATSASGERHIPSSTRADGSVRKEIRVRPGYRPPEDVEVYKNRTAEAWKNRGSGGVPGADALKSEGDPSKGSAASNKNAKRREARKKAAAAAAAGPAEGGPAKEVDASRDVEPDEEAQKPVDPAVEKEKEAKKLLKKLRQARDLKDKKEKGDVLLPEQFEKVIKINELMRQLENLGINPNEDKKAET
ncbi:hypothetical protein K491DRAFT_682557 [Lophiostoma macrostomum CBS 122681]|uniref:WIBG Mago-binding domain-containing protein n=1 Tax=Lophiostoma macrostomum CBS 122681 TaxID=1314788 RepID=A0A6A6ST39_9PLEO|nr:hypothetical protein K491DRAFT_682557 [Lophiostoma macrostomum CBS 122681]